MQHEPMPEWLDQSADMTGYVSLLSGGITQEGINVIYLSTYNTDLLLVGSPLCSSVVLSVITNPTILLSGG